MEFVLGWNVSRHSMNWLVETFSWAPEEFSTWMRRGTNSKEVLKGKTILAPVHWLRSVKNGGVCFIARYVEGIMLPQIFGPKELAIDTPELLLWSQSSHHHTSPILAMRWLRLIRMAWTQCFMSSAVLERRHLDIVAPYDPRPTGPLRSSEWSMNFQWSSEATYQELHSIKEMVEHSSCVLFPSHLRKWRWKTLWTLTQCIRMPKVAYTFRELKRVPSLEVCSEGCTISSFIWIQILWSGNVPAVPKLP